MRRFSTYCMVQKNDGPANEQELEGFISNLPNLKTKIITFMAETLIKCFKDQIELKSILAGLDLVVDVSP